MAMQYGTSYSSQQPDQRRFVGGGMSGSTQQQTPSYQPSGMRAPTMQRSPTMNQFNNYQQQGNTWDSSQFTRSTQPATSPYTSAGSNPYTTNRMATGRGGYDVVREPQTWATGYQAPQGQQANVNQFSYYPGLDPQTMQSNDERDAALQSVQMNVPISQLNQNAYQYAQDFNEAQRRWDSQFGYQQQLDQFNMGLASQQFGLQDWQARQAANQWGQEFARQQGLDSWNQQFANQQFGLQDWQTRQQMEQQQQQINNQMAYQTGQLGLGNRQADIQQQYQQGQLDMGNRELDIRNQYQQGQLDLGNRQAGIQDAYNQGQLSLGNRQADIQTMNYGNQFFLGNRQADIQSEANRINQAYNSGRLSNEQRQLALAELTQQQNFGLQQEELARRYGLDAQTQAQLEAFRRSQLTQEGDLARAQMANQKEIAMMQAYGRNQAPNTRWMRAG